MNLTAIVQAAKDMILKHGEHVPTLMVESNQGMDILVLASFPETTLDKQKALFLSGREYGLASLGRTISQLAFIVEAWVSIVPKEDARKVKHIRPSQDPKRKECLIVTVCDCVPPKLKQSLYMIEMLRDGQGNLVDLLPKSDPMEGVQSMLLPAFLAGFFSASLSDKEMAETIKRYS